MVKVQVAQAKRFITDCLGAVGAKLEPSVRQANLLTYADITGYRIHGICKLESCLTDIKDGVCKPNNTPLMLKDKPSIAWVDANGVMGATVGAYAMDLAIEKANKTGVGWVAVKGPHQWAEPHSYWSQQATGKGLIGMVFKNTASAVRPVDDTPQRKEQLSGSEQPPIKIVMPSLPKVPKVFKPRGRRPATTHREFDLVLQSYYPPISSTSDFSDTRSSATKDQPWLTEPLMDNLSHSYVVINPVCYALGFENKLFENNPQWKQIMKPMDPELLVLPLCKLEKRIISEPNETDTIEYETRQINACANLAKELNVKPMVLK